MEHTPRESEYVMGYFPEGKPETQRKRRGHAFYPPQAVLRKVPKLHGTDGTPLPEKVIHVHYFVGGHDWYVAELDREKGEAWGYTVLSSNPDGAEWGYIDLPELEAAAGPEVQARMHTEQAFNFRTPVERDCHWSPKPFAEAVKEGASR